MGSDEQALDQSEQAADRPQRRRRWWWLLVLVPLLVTLDGLHAIYIAYAVDAWTDQVELNEDGVIARCEAYSLSADNGNAAEAAILLVHGFNASPRHYDFVAPALSELGYDCRVMRLPKFAEPFALSDEHDSREWVAAVTTELKELRSKHDRVGIVGHSLGGAVTIGALLDNPEAADFAVLLAPAVAVSDDRAPLLSTRTWHEVSQRLLVFTRVLQTPFPMDCHVEGRTDYPGRMPFSSREMIDTLFTLMDSNLRRVEEWATPVTMVVCRDDPIVDTPAAERYFEAIAHEDKELIILENSGHEVPLDQEWERVVEIIAKRASR